MPTNTYVALKKETIAVATGTVDIDLVGTSGYTDLVLVMNFTPASGSMNPVVQVGDGTVDTAGNYSQTFVSGTGSVINSNRTTNATSFQSYINAATTNQSTVIVEIRSYSSTSIFKSVIVRANGSGETTASVGTWRSTSAINKIKITAGSNFAVGSTFSLYGIATGAVPTTAKATGGTIYYGMDGYIYHKFTAGGSFVPSSTISADALIVAGGGGGGAGAVGGGGGAGGLRAFVNQALTSGTTYTVTVGGAGSAGVWEFTKGGTGGPSSISGTGLTTIEAAGGGGGGSGDQTSAGPGVSGGSGGGGNYQGLSAGGAGNTPATTPSQGNDGGAGGPSTAYGGGGGGASTASYGYFGGNGSDIFSDWGSITSSGQNVLGKYWFAGGGGGGVRNSAGITSIGGNGGGGAGSKTSVGTAGTTNTGGGGGGTGWEANNTAGGSAGGSGIVIIRYLG
jgi:hypothetical protein